MKITNPEEWDGTVFHNSISKVIWYILILKDNVFLCYDISSKTNTGGSAYTVEELEDRFSSGEWTKLFNMSEEVKEAQNEIGI
jgi:hypothetical protein